MIATMVWLVINLLEAVAGAFLSATEKGEQFVIVAVFWISWVFLLMDCE